MSNLGASDIDHNKTEVVTIAGNSYYHNENVKALVNIKDGNLFSYIDGGNGNLIVYKKINPNTKGMYSIRIEKDNKVGYLYINHDNILNRLLNLNLGRFEKIKLINENNGFITGNIKLIHSYGYAKPSKPSKPSNPSSTKGNQQDQLSIVNSANRVSYVTSDLNEFFDNNDAMAHQDVIDSGINAVNMILEAKAGWALAENVYNTYVSMSHKHENFKTFVESEHKITKKHNDLYEIKNLHVLNNTIDALKGRTFSKSDADLIIEIADLIKSIK